MGFAVGVMLALAVGLSATWIGLDRDRALYPAVMIVVASYYVLFAVMGGSTQTMIIESAVATLFLAVYIAGFKSTLWLVVVALSAHGIFDLVHGRFIINPGVPSWWPAFCSTYDVAAASYLGCLLFKERINARAS